MKILILLAMFIQVLLIIYGISLLGNTDSNSQLLGSIFVILNSVFLGMNVSNLRRF